MNNANDYTKLAAVAAVLGAEATTDLLTAPLSVIMREKVAATYGIDLGDAPTLADGVAMVGRVWYEKRADRRKIVRGLRLLRKLAHEESVPVPTMDAFARLSHGQKVACVQRAWQAEQRTQGAEREAYSQFRKVAGDALYISLKKEANAASAASSVFSDLATTAAKGLAAGTAATVPLVIGANHVAEKATNNAVAKAEEAAMNTGMKLTAGAAGVGALLKALPFGQNSGQKAASSQTLEAQFLSCAYAEAYLDNYAGSEKVAALQRELREHAVEILCTLSQG